MIGVCEICDRVGVAVKDCHVSQRRICSSCSDGRTTEPKHAPYTFCRTPEKCAGKGYCPADIACND